MSVRKCLLGKVEAGVLTSKQMAEIEDRLGKYEEKNRLEMGPEQAEALAAKQAMEAITKERALKNRQTKVTLSKQASLIESRKNYKGNTHQWILSEMDIDPWAGNKNAPVSNLQEIHRNRAFSMMNNVLEEFRPRLAGLKRPRAGADDVIRELHGQNTGLETAKELADGFRAAGKYLWTEFNRHSGDAIPWRDDWAMPHKYDAVKTGAIKPEEMVADFTKELNREKMVDFDTGQKLSDKELAKIITDAHENIRTHGMSDMTPGIQSSKAIGNRRSDARIFHFKDGDAWMRINEKYGAGDPIDQMYEYVHGMSRDIGLMEKFGPNPKNMVKTLKDMATKEEITKPGEVSLERFKERSKQGTLGWQIDRSFEQLTGANNVAASTTGAGFFSAVRSTLTGILLQASTLTAVTDLNGQRIAYRMMGHGPVAAIVKSLPNLINNFTAAMPDKQQLALHLGLGADSWTHSASGSARYVGESVGPEWSRRFSDVTMRMIGLTPWTQGGKNVIGLDFYHLLHQNIGNTYDKILPALRDEMEKFGLNESHWGLMQKADPLVAKNGAKYVNPQNILALGDSLSLDAATRLQNMELTLQRRAIIETTPRAKGLALGETKPGTIPGEIMRNTLLFKSFPMALIQMQLFNAVQSRTGWKGKAGMFASVVIGSTVFGALAVQMKNIANGKDPQNMDPSTQQGMKFWGSALAQGGGLGIFGDYLFADQNRFGKGFWASMGGPVVDLADDVGRVTVGNAQQAIAGEDMDLKGDAADMVRKYVPGGKFWYWKLAFERNVLDQLDMAADPKAHQRFQRQQDKFWKERKQKYWWKPGSQAPQRAPDMSAATGQ